MSRCMTDIDKFACYQASRKIYGFAFIGNFHEIIQSRNEIIFLAQKWKQQIIKILTSIAAAQSN